MRRIRVAHDHAGEGIVLHLAEQVQAVEPLQVVEAVAALQVLHLPSNTKLKVEPSMPPNGMVFSARPPIHRSTLSRPPSVRRHRRRWRSGSRGDPVESGDRR